MVSLVPVGETIPYERAQHTVLLVEAVEERTNMTMPTENIAAEPGLVCRGLHIHTLTKRGPRYAVRTGLAPPGSIPRSTWAHAAATGLRPGYVRCSLTVHGRRPAARSGGRRGVPRPGTPGRHNGRAGHGDCEADTFGHRPLAARWPAGDRVPAARPQMAPRRKGKSGGQLELTTNLTTTSSDNLPSVPASQAGPCQVSHGMPQPARILQPGGHGFNPLGSTLAQPPNANEFRSTT